MSEMETSSPKKPVIPIVTVGRPGSTAVERPNRWAWPIAWLVGLASLLLLVALPGGVLNKLVLLDSGVCPQRPGHSYFFEGRQMPLEARMVGIFAGFGLTVFGLWLVGRGRALNWPRRAISLGLAALVAPMVVDGVNSTFLDLGWPTLYEPQNWLRVLTGAVSGVGMAGLILPGFSLVVWRRGYLTPTFKSWGEIGLALIPALLYIGGVLSGWGWLFWPLSLLAVAGVITMLVMFNTMIVTVVIRRENQASTLTDFVALMTPIYLLSIGMMVGLAVLRMAVAGGPGTF